MEYSADDFTINSGDASSYRWNPAAYDHPQSSTADGSGNSATSNSVAHQSSPSSVTTLLSYPHDFFNTTTGAGPKDTATAAALWQYRKHRPPIGTVDLEPADGMKMLKEIRSMRHRLKSHIENTFLEDARKMAEVWNLKVPSTNRTPHTPKDFVKALVGLKRVEGSLESERIVYMVCHHFHHQREWLCNAVDAWCLEEKIKIEYTTGPTEAGGVRKRVSPTSRGGFGAYARNVKSEVVKHLMRNMLNQAGWSISTKDNSKQGKEKKYEPISIRIDTTLTEHTCYLVTWSDAGKMAAGKKVDGGSTAVMGSSENRIEVDHIGFGAHVCRQLGVPVSKETLQGLWSNYKPRSDLVGCDIETQNGAPGEEVSDLTLPQDHLPAVSTTAALGAGTAAAPTLPAVSSTSTSAAHTTMQSEMASIYCSPHTPVDGDSCYFSRLLTHHACTCQCLLSSLMKTPSPRAAVQFNLLLLP